MPAIAAAGVLGVVVMAGVTSGGDSGTPPASSAETAAAAATVAGSELEAVSESLTVPPTTQPNVVIDSTLPAVQKSSLAGPIAVGSYGGDVLKVQERLIELGFSPGPADGYFGELTQHAVWAYKKLVMRVPRTELAESSNAALVTNDTWLGMQDPITIQPRRPLGAGSRHVEIYLPEQVMAVFHGDKPTMIAHIASGDDQEWCELVTYDTNDKGEPLEEPVERDECGVSYTPGGVFRFNRRYEGNRQSPLGGMFNPVYFNYGIAVHGARNVPLSPASHGCIRIHMELAETFPGLVQNGDRVYVWGQDGKEPEHYTKRETLPRFNWINPNSTTTTSSSTTTTTSTIAPSTTTSTLPKTTVASATTAVVTTAAPATIVPAVTTAAVTSPPTTAAPATAPPTAAPEPPPQGP